MSRLVFFGVSALFVLSACTSSKVKIGEDDGGLDGGLDGGAVDGGAVDGGAVDGGEPCGDNHCGDGEYCCNPSCGFCAATGEACPAIGCEPEPVVCNGVECSSDTAVCCPGCNPGESFCSGPEGVCPLDACPEPVECLDGTSCGPGEQCCPGCRGAFLCIEDGLSCPVVDCPPPSCAPQDATAAGACDLFLGYAWNGTTCAPLSGCDCTGADCGALFPSEEACLRAHQLCIGCDNDNACGEGFWCDSCALSSCPSCDDCIAGCRANTCPDLAPLSCRRPRPECGAAYAIVGTDGCWQCVDPVTCEPILGV